MDKLKFFGIPQFQKGGLVNQQYSGTWGNRGQGNELQSALENGLSWTWDKVTNAGDYIEQGLGWLVGLIPGDTSQEEFVQDIKNKQLARNSGESGYVNSKGNYVLLPMTGTPPPLPGLPKNPSALTLAIRNRMIPVRKSLAVRESQLKAAGQLDKLPQTKTYKLYHQLQKEFDKSLKPTKSVDRIKLTKRQNASFKSHNSMNDGDNRHALYGRSAIKESQWNEVERMMRKDKNTTVQSMLNKYDLKVAKGKDWTALRKSRINMLKWYLNNHAKGFFSWLKD